jgi:hypothetical protein
VALNFFIMKSPKSSWHNSPATKWVWGANIMKRVHLLGGTFIDHKVSGASLEYNGAVWRYQHMKPHKFLGTSNRNFNRFNTWKSKRFKIEFEVDTKTNQIGKMYKLEGRVGTVEVALIPKISIVRHWINRSSFSWRIQLTSNSVKVPLIHAGQLRNPFCTHST